MKCKDIEFGTYNCSYCIMPPFATGYFEKKLKACQLQMSYT